MRSLRRYSYFVLTVVLDVVHGKLNSLYMISGSCRISQKCVTDVTDGLIFVPLSVLLSQFQNQTVSKLGNFETRATERGLMSGIMTSDL